MEQTLIFLKFSDESEVNGSKKCWFKVNIFKKS